MINTHCYLCFRATAVPGERPTPFELWKQRNTSTKAKQPKVKETPKLTSSQWDKLVNKMSQTNRVKQRYQYLNYFQQ